MVLQAIDETIFFLRFVLIASCAHVQKPIVPSGGGGGGGTNSPCRLGQFGCSLCGAWGNAYLNAECPTERPTAGDS